MDVNQRTELFADLASGDLTLRDLAELKQRDIDSIAHLGRVAFESKKFDQAAAIFLGLQTLEADRPTWALYRAEAEAAAGRREDAIATITAFIELDAAIDTTDLVRAALLRATLLKGHDDVGAAVDLRVAELLAQQSDDAKNVLKAAGL